jgi:hypothetical protein
MGGERLRICKLLQRQRILSHIPGYRNIEAVGEKASRKTARRRRRGINCRKCGSSEVDVEVVVDESFVVEGR